MLWHSARLKKDREQHLSGTHFSATKGHLCICKSGQTQSECHSYPSEKSHYRQSCHSPGAGMFLGVLLANSQWGRNPVSTAGTYSPSAHPHIRQLLGRSKNQTCRWAHRSEGARSCSPLIHQCLVHSCHGPQARKTHPKSCLYLGMDQTS